MTAVRYAIYFVPPPQSPLYQFGSSALGYDSYTGHDVVVLAGDGMDAAEWHQLTAEPRRYGFHATLKAPFHPANGASESDLVAALARFAGHQVAPPQFSVALKRLDGFAALVPSEPASALDRLADTCVQDFDRFRAPLTEAERKRRLAQPLTARQIQQLDRWGYPYVFEDFRFHMTLTGRIPDQQAAGVLAFLHGALERRPVPGHVTVDRVALLRQERPDAAFRVISNVALGQAPRVTSGRSVSAAE